MKATHYMKVNGRWVQPGEEYGVPAAAAPKTPLEITAEDVIPEAQSAEEKPARKSRKKAG